MGIFGSLLAGNVSKRLVEAYRSEYQAWFSSYPPADAVEYLSTAATIIGSFAGAGKDDLGASRLASAVDSYARAVGFNERKVGLGIALLFTLCSKSNGDPAHGYVWAYNVLNNKAWEHCPNFSGGY